MTEADLLRGVLDLCRVLGWRTLHVRPARTAHGWRTAVQGDGAGFPDVLALRGDCIVAAELKADRGNLTDEQRDWLAAFAASGADVHVWRPVDYPDAIAAVLR
jgi:hypothetical protein